MSGNVQDIPVCPHRECTCVTNKRFMESERAVKLHIDISEKHKETVITIQAEQWTDELAELVKYIQNPRQTGEKRLVGVQDDRSILLEPAEIDYVFAEKRKVFASTKGQSIELRMKLYEVEEMLGRYSFMRFSKSVIGNLERISRFELSFNGNLCVYFQSGSKEYVSRAYVSKLKERLILGGGKSDL